MSTPSVPAVEGVFRHLIYSPKGETEGLLLEAHGAPLQLVFEHHDAESSAAFHDIEAGQVLRVQAEPQGPSPKGRSEHPVYTYGRLLSVDGRKPARREAAPEGGAYRGRVVRFNYARHGVANGVVLDSGDFIHTKPGGMARLKLKVGDAVHADGDAHRLADDRGWAVEATSVNGKAVEPH